MGTEMAGIMATAPAAVAGVASKIPALMPVAGQTLRNVGRNVALQGTGGMVEGGSLSAAKGENLYLGVGAGGVGGALGVLALPVAKWVTKKFFTPVKKLITKKTPEKELTKAEIKGEQMIE